LTSQEQASSPKATASKLALAVPTMPSFGTNATPSTHWIRTHASTMNIAGRGRLAAISAATSTESSAMPDMEKTRIVSGSAATV
jgi:hypothetical protein